MNSTSEVLRHAHDTLQTALHCATPVISDGPETIKRYVNGRGRIMKEIPLFHAAPEQAWVLSALNGPPGEPHSAPEGKWG